MAYATPQQTARAAGVRARETASWPEDGIISRGRGNRRKTGAGGNNSGGGLHYANYRPNWLNEFISREVPGAVQSIGTANPSATVTLWSGNWRVDHLYTMASRKGTYYWGELLPNNTTGAMWLTVTNLAVVQNGTNPDIVTNTVGDAFLPQTLEYFYYDVDGNLTTDGRWTYSWDAENRLVSLVAGTSVGPQQLIKFEYDWRGRRIHKQVWNNTGGTGNPATDLRFVYDGWNLLAVLNPASSILDSFMWGLDLSGSVEGAGGVGGLLEVTYYATQTTNCFAAYDGNGNVAGLVNAADGKLVGQYEYGPFGEVLRATGPMGKVNPFRFSTKSQEDEADLLYYGYRYYSPSQGRWPSRDSIAERGGPNLYGLLGNQPIARWDYLGQANPSSPDQPPSNNIDPPPAGPFSKCSIALSCSTAHGPLGVPVFADHCGLIIDTGNGLYALDGSGGTVNSRWVTPASASQATGPFTDNNPSVCDCLFSNVRPWNDRKVPRDDFCANSNWNLKCALRKCGPQVDWGTRSKPIGYDCQECKEWRVHPAGIGEVYCCVRWEEKRCPDE